MSRDGNPRHGGGVTGVWAIGASGTGEDLDLRRTPAGPGGPLLEPSFLHVAVDTEYAPEAWWENATQLYFPPGLASLQRSPRLSLRERAAQAFDTLPALRVVGAALDERRCWAQLQCSDPVVLTLDEPAADADPRILATLLHLRRIPNRPPLPSLGHTLRLNDTISLRLHGHPVRVTITAPDPATDQRIDTCAPRPVPARTTPVGQRPTWRDAAHCARALQSALPVSTGGDGEFRATEQRNLMTLLVYAVACETGQPVDAVTVAQLRYRLGEAEWDEDRPLARQRCLDWLYQQLWQAGHQVGGPPTRPDDAELWDPMVRFRRYLARLAELDTDPSAPAPQVLRDDPVVRAWSSVIHYEVHDDFGDSDGLSTGSRRWFSTFDHLWARLVERVDAALITEHAVWANDTPVRLPSGHPGLIRAPRWRFDHTKRTASSLLGYFVTEYHGNTEQGHYTDRPAPIAAERLEHGAGRAGGPCTCRPPR